MLTNRIDAKRLKPQNVLAVHILVIRRKYALREVSLIEHPVEKERLAVKQYPLNTLHLSN